jgi:hypothetical protein
LSYNTTLKPKLKEFLSQQGISLKDNAIDAACKFINDEIIELIQKDKGLIIELVKEIQSKEKPRYIDDLIQEGYIAGDGKTALASLDNIAEFLKTKIESVTPKLLMVSFIQDNGKKFSPRTAQDAVYRNKT